MRRHHAEKVRDDPVLIARLLGMRPEPTGEVRRGPKIEKRLAQGFNGRKRKLADGLLLTGRERTQAARQLPQDNLDFTQMPAFLTTLLPTLPSTFLPAFGDTEPDQRISAQDFFGNLHAPHATQFSLQFQTLLPREFLVREKEAGHDIQLRCRPLCPHRIADEINHLWQFIPARLSTFKRWPCADAKSPSRKSGSVVELI
jgi:hypothetical protein